MNEPRLICEVIRTYASLESLTFCDLHKCMEPDKCKRPQQHEMLNFDEVKNVYCKESGIRHYKSADGLSYNDNSILFFIEIKGWKLYQKHANPQSEKEVREKVNKYGLSKKLHDSLIICRSILSKKKASVTVPVVYLVVSDIKRDEAVEEIEHSLLLLSETSSNLSHVYEEEIQYSLSDISDIDFGFISDCRRIDDEINSWKKAREVKLV